MSELAILGGKPVVTAPLPHDVWPPPAEQPELQMLAAQRNLDIGIRGRSGPIADLENDFLSFMEDKIKYAVTFNSGTSALLAAYFAVGVEEGTEVIGPALTYHAALSPVFTLRGDVVLADVEESTRCIDVKDIERLITPKTRVITVVHQWGHPANMDAIMELARKRDLRVVEDCSHAHGSRYRGKLCGTFGDVAAFSLQTNKTIFAGEGGILVTNEQRYADRATLFGHYRDRCKAEIEDEQLKRFWVTGFGLKLRMSPFNAIVARHSLARFPEIKAVKHRCLRYFSCQLEGIDYIDAPYVAPDVDMGAWYGFKPIYRKEKLRGISRATLIKALRAEGLEIDGPSGPTLGTQPLYAASNDPLFPSGRRRHANNPAHTPVARFLEDSALSLPTFWRWDSDSAIIDGYIEAFEKVARNAEALERFEASV
jgi:dTDP-4-amino-4,6-dideoxygalactose transaminase